MSEVQVSYETRAYRYQCDVCKEGEMVATGDLVLTTLPPMYPSKCSSCSFTANLLYRYPRLETKAGPIDEPETLALTPELNEQLSVTGMLKRRPGRPPKNA